MVLAPDGDRKGGALDGFGPCTASRQKFGRFAETSVLDEPEGRLAPAARPGGAADSDECNWQQGWAAIMAGSQPVIIARQQEWQGAGAKHASAGAAAQRATTASIKIAPFLPMGIM